MASQQLINAQIELQRRRERDGVSYRSSVPVDSGWLAESDQRGGKRRETATTTSLPETVRAYPTILTAMLKQGLAAPGRVYLLMQAMDQDSRGWLGIDRVKERLTSQGSTWRICDWPRLLQIFNQGEAILWDRRGDRIWLRTPARVPLSFQCGRLRGNPVGLPIRELLAGIQQTKAQFYAAFLSGRKHSNPITRDTLHQLTGVPPSTQRVYERVAGIVVEHNLAIGEPYTAEGVEQRAWKNGGTFRFIDGFGIHGKPGQARIAWHLGNSYRTRLEQLPKGRQKKINRRIDLVHKGARGNGSKADQIYYPNGAAAGSAYNRDPRHDRYFPSTLSRVFSRGCFWYVLPGGNHA